MLYFIFIFVLPIFILFCSGEDPLDSSIYGPQAVNGAGQLASPDQVLNNEKNSTMNRQLSEMSQYEGATLGQPSKSYENNELKRGKKYILTVVFLSIKG